MIRFIDLGKFGENRAASYILTISVIFLSYVIGSFGLFIDYSLHAGFDGAEASMSDFILVNLILVKLAFIQK